MGLDFNIEYNTTRPKLNLSEYGRNIQNIVDYIMTLPTKEERNKYALALIDIMGTLNPHLRDVADFKHKLWDHLFIISDFKLDVDSPYPIPSRETLVSKTDPLKYPVQKIRFKHYGKTVELMIEKVKDITEEDRKSEFINSIANFMKMAYVNWNKDNVSDETIISDLKILSKGEIVLEEGTNLNRVESRPKPRTNMVHRNKNQGRHNNQNANNNNPNYKKNQNRKKF